MSFLSDVELNLEFRCGDPVYCDNELQLLNYLDRWEEQNSSSYEEDERGKSVSTIAELRAASKPECKADIKTVFPPLTLPLEYAIQKTCRDLYLLGSRQRPSEQMRAYKYWRKIYLRNMVLPQPSHFSGKRLYDLLKRFPVARDLTDIAVLFGFADQLPEQLRNPEREKWLIWSRSWLIGNYREILADHERLLKEIETMKELYAKLDACKAQKRQLQENVSFLETENEEIRQLNLQLQQKCQAQEEELQRIRQLNLQLQQKCQAQEEELQQIRQLNLQLRQKCQAQEEELQRCRPKKSWLEQLHAWLGKKVGPRQSDI